MDHGPTTAESGISGSRQAGFYACQPAVQRAQIVVVDDEAGTRDTVRLLLESQRYTVTTFSSAAEFLEARLRGHFCLLLDVCMPGMDGLELLHEIRGQGLDVPVIFMTGCSDVAIAVQAMKAGAIDFLEKPLSARTLFASVENAAKKLHEATEILLATNSADSLLSRLTVRESEVLSRIATGLSNKVTAIELSLSPRTVELHRSRIMHKTGAKNLADLVRIFLTGRDVLASGSRSMTQQAAVR